MLPEMIFSLYKCNSFQLIGAFPFCRKPFIRCEDLIFHDLAFLNEIKYSHWRSHEYEVIMKTSFILDPTITISIEITIIQYLLEIRMQMCEKTLIIRYSIRHYNESLLNIHYNMFIGTDIFLNLDSLTSSRLVYWVDISRLTLTHLLIINASLWISFHFRV